MRCLTWCATTERLFPRSFHASSSSEADDSRTAAKCEEFSLQHLFLDTMSTVELGAQAKGISLFAHFGKCACNEAYAYSHSQSTSTNSTTTTVSQPYDDGSLHNNICTDRIRLRQILIQLVNNAVKFTSSGEVNLSVWVNRVCTDADGVDDREGKKSGELVCVISDTGCGMEESQTVELFKPFGQADTSKTRRFGGLGIGLALSRGIAAQIGGKLSLLRSAPGEGSSFVLSVPIVLSSTSNLQEKFKLRSKSKPKRRSLRNSLRLHGRASLKALASTLMLTNEDTSTESRNQAEDETTDAISTDSRNRSDCMGNNLASVEERPESDIRDSLFAKSLRQAPIQAIPREIREDCRSPKSRPRYTNLQPSQYEFESESEFKFKLKTPKLDSRSLSQSISKPTSTVSSLNQTPAIISEATAVKFPLNILVVDDHIINRRLMVKMLSVAGYIGDSVTLAEDGEQAFELAKTSHFDIILMDIQMPKMDGNQSTRAILEHYKQDKSDLTPPAIIAVTAHFSPEDKKLSMSCGMCDYVTKPVDWTLMFAKIIHWRSVVKSI